MKHLAASFIFLLVMSLVSSAQEGGDSVLQSGVRVDSVRLHDSLMKAQRQKDSLLKASQARISRMADSLKVIVSAKRKAFVAHVQTVLKDNAAFNLAGSPMSQVIEVREVRNNDGLFYFIIGLVLYIALMRLIFYKYMSTMFTLFFRATLRQQQLREQLLQAPLPALLMNIFFVISMGAYCTLVAGHFGWEVADGFWHTLGYAVLLIAGIYLAKFIFLNVAGWIFSVTAMTDTYIFIVFLINKMLGIFLVPIIALLAFPRPELLPSVLMISYFLIGGMFFYRFISAYRPVRAEIKLNRFHFFLYLCAFEIAPLLLIYKVLLTYMARST